GVTWVDLNNDGYSDIIVNTTADGDYTHIYIHNQTDPPTFTDATLSMAAGLLEEQGSRSVVAADLNNDGYVDIVNAFHTKMNVFLSNGPDQTGQWTLGNYGQPNHQVDDTWWPGFNVEGVGVLDYNNDGWLDIVADAHDLGFIVLLNTQLPFSPFAVDDSTGLPSAG
ncbi:MAG: VCBS repeat-containing protein, partial [Proteobacteria bacterium]|nr:VCBS repeat-containing protein [Pseudomonadota bacterium]